MRPFVASPLSYKPLTLNLMNTQKTSSVAASYVPPVCKVINLELDGAVLAASGSGSFVDMENGGTYGDQWITL